MGSGPPYAGHFAFAIADGADGRKFRAPPLMVEHDDRRSRARKTAATLTDSPTSAAKTTNFRESVGALRIKSTMSSSVLGNLVVFFRRAFFDVVARLWFRSL